MHLIYLYRTDVLVYCAQQSLLSEGKLVSVDDGLLSSFYCYDLQLMSAPTLALVLCQACSTGLRST